MPGVRGAASSRAGRRVSTGVINCLLCALVVQGCTLRKPQAPSTEFTISLPIADVRTTIEELATDTGRRTSAYLSIEDDRLLSLDFSTRFDHHENVGDRLSLKPIEAAFTARLDDIHLPEQTLPDIVIPLHAIHDPDRFPEHSDGIIPVLPPVPFERRQTISLAGVESLDVESGRVDIQVANGLPVDSAPLRLVLIDAGRGDRIIDVMELDRLDAGATATGTFELDGKRISGSLWVDIAGSTAEATDVDLTGAGELIVSAGLSPLVVSAATAIIPEQEFLVSQELAFPDDRIQIARATIRDGGLTLHVRNDISVPSTVELSLDEVLRPDGRTHTVRLDGLEPGEVREVHFDLTDSDYVPANPLELQLSCRVRIRASEEVVRLEAGEQVMIDALTEELYFDRVEGVLNRVELPTEPVITEVDFHRGLDNLALASTRLRIYLRSAVGFRSRINLDIRGTNRAGRTANLQISEVFQRGSYADPVSMVLEPESAELTDFLNLLPREVEVRPTVLIGDGLGAETITPDHWVRVDSVQFLAPGRLTVLAPTSIEPEPEYRDLQGEEARRRIESNLISARVMTDIENHLPIGISVSLRVTSWSRIVHDVIVAAHPHLSQEGAMLDWLVQHGIWHLITGSDRQEIQERMAISLGLQKTALIGADVATILDRILADDHPDSRTLFVNLLLGSLINVYEGDGQRQVETLLGQDITPDEWEEIIAAAVYETPELYIPPEGGPFAIPAAQVDAAGHVTESRFSRRDIELTKEQITVFLRKGGVYTGVCTEIDATQGEVALFAENYATVRAATKIRMELNKHLFQD